MLVVEDDHGVRDVLARELREEGFHVTTAADGASALRTVESGAAAVVLDVGLPDSDGRDVCQAMRARGIDAPVLFLTAYDGVTDRLSGFSAQYFLRHMGVDGFILSPSVTAALVRAGVVDKPPTSKKAMEAVQAAFDSWRKESGRSFSEISRTLGMSIDA